MAHKTGNYYNMRTPEYSPSDPEVWGPVMWSFLHLTAASYPHHPELHLKNNMKSFILSIPSFIQCGPCAEDSHRYITSRKKLIDSYVSSKKNLFIFFWEFHNYVNLKLGKPQIQLEAAWNKYYFGV